MNKSLFLFSHPMVLCEALYGLTASRSSVLMYVLKTEFALRCVILPEANVTRNTGGGSIVNLRNMYVTLFTIAPSKNQPKSVANEALICRRFMSMPYVLRGSTKNQNHTCCTSSCTSYFSSGRGRRTPPLTLITYPKPLEHPSFSHRRMLRK